MTTPDPAMPSPNQAWPLELDALTAVSSIVDVIGRHVGDLAPIPAEELTDWLAGLTVRAGWEVTHLDARAVPLARVTAHRPEAGEAWDGCETISVFRFTGIPPRDVVEANAESTLRDLGAHGIFTTVAPPPPPVAAVRSSGYLRIAGRSLWARNAAYVAGSDISGKGRLIQHSMFVDLRSRTPAEPRHRSPDQLCPQRVPR